jgi:multidrug efflux pump subunit AcrA (membrane-fusion protein)
MIPIGFFLERLLVRGPGKPDAVLDFIDGLNVVAGASDTGKSFAVSCIDYGFGASKPPRRIDAARGYDTLLVTLTERATGHRFEIERTLAGGDVIVRRLGSKGEIVEEKIVAAKHDGDNVETLSGHLLNWSGLWGKQLRKNAKGERRSLSFRDLAFLVVVDEERIIAERPPHQSGLPQDRTLEGDALRLLATGEESGRVIAPLSAKDLAGHKAKVELVDQLINDAVIEFKKFGIDEAALPAEIERLEASRKLALSDFDLARQGTVELESELAQLGKALRDVQSRIAVVEGLRQRFTLLGEHYESDFRRLEAIEETGRLLDALPSTVCPVCGAPSAEHQKPACAPVYRIEDVQLAAAKEQDKIAGLRSDLEGVLGQLEVEAGELVQQQREIATTMDSIKRLIEQELMPRIRQSSESLQAQADQRDLALRANEAAGEIARLRRLAEELEEAKRRDKPARLASGVSTADMEKFAMSVEALLREWNYPDAGRTVFSEDEQDLVIGDQLRTSHGKGVRALTCAAFIIGLMRHCLERDHPHPSLVILDSPLVAYEEADADEENARIRHAGVKEAFYRSLAAGGGRGQLIIFENDDPPGDLKDGMRWHHFTKSKTGRYGFFPVAP